MWTWENVNSTLRLGEISSLAKRAFPRLSSNLSRSASKTPPPQFDTGRKGVGHASRVSGNFIVGCLAGLGAFALALSASALVYNYYKHVRSQIMIPRTILNGKGVVITGCDSGIGQATALKMATAHPEVYIFAGCLTNEGLDHLKKHNLQNLIPLMLDITQSESVVTFLNAVRRNIGNDRLLALVNVAGIYDGYFIELTPINIFSQVMEAFLPLLERSEGKIINILSLSAVCAAPTTCAYAASKHALSVFSDCLRNEAKEQGIKVIKVYPGAVKTPALKSIPKRYIEICGNANSKQSSKYGGNAFAKAYGDFLRDLYTRADNADLPAKDIIKIVFSQYPRDCYYLGTNLKWFYMLLSMSPTVVHDFFFDVKATKAALLKRGK